MMPTMKRETVRVTLNLDKPVADKLDDTAAAQRRNRSSMANYLFWQALMSGGQPPAEIEEQPTETAK